MRRKLQELVSELGKELIPKRLAQAEGISNETSQLKPNFLLAHRRCFTAISL